MQWFLNRVISFTLVLSFSSTLPATTRNQMVEYCEEEGRKYGDGSGADLISTKCIELYCNRAGHHATIVGKNDSFKISGFKNMIFTRNKDLNGNWTTNIIAGLSTELDSVIAINYDQKNEEIAALDSSGDILFFSSTLTGNVAPYRILRAKELKGASHLVVDPIKNEVIVLNKNEGSILFFSRLANFKGREGKRNLSLIRSFDGLSEGIESLAISVMHREIFVVDAKQNNIFVFNLDAEESLVRKIQGDKTRLSGPYLIRYDQKKDHLVVTNKSGDELLFERDGSGNITPLKNITRDI